MYNIKNKMEPLIKREDVDDLVYHPKNAKKI